MSNSIDRVLYKLEDYLDDGKVNNSAEGKAPPKGTGKTGAADSVLDKATDMYIKKD